MFGGRLPFMVSAMSIRFENPGDSAQIRTLVLSAFEGVSHSLQNEARILDALRAAGALTLSLVEEVDGKILGHIAFSPVFIENKERGWFGLGPLSVAPEAQGKGIGRRLIEKGLDMMRAQGAAGIVLLGDPDFYGKFGFKGNGSLRLPGVPPTFFLVLPFTTDMIEGVVSYHKAFGVT